MVSLNSAVFSQNSAVVSLNSAVVSLNSAPINLTLTLNYIVPINLSFCHFMILTCLSQRKWPRYRVDLHQVVFQVTES